MSDGTKIEWTDATWNPITGCTLVSEGCRHCYAAQLAATRLKHHWSRQGLARVNAVGEAKFTGEVRFNREWLTQPLKWARPRTIFVCAHGDLFHESVPDAWIDEVFAVMALCPQHTFQVLTKRPERMLAYLTRGGEDGNVVRNHLAWVAVPKVMDQWHPAWIGEGPAGPHRSRAIASFTTWPLPNVWLGVSVEDQAAADARLRHLVVTPAAVRFASVEPLLGPIDLNPWLYIVTVDEDEVLLQPEVPGEPLLELPYNDPATTPDDEISTYRLDWVIVGGESGAGARPMHPGWARSVRDQCADADVPFFFKQWGEHLPLPEYDASGAFRIVDDVDVPSAVRREAGFDQVYHRIGKRAAGRHLDGQLHDGMPAR